VLYRKEPEVDRVLALFEDPQHDILLSTVSVAEFGRKLRELGKDQEEIEDTLNQFMQLFSHVVPLGEAEAGLVNGSLKQPVEIGPGFVPPA
jgi:septation ring formation regulator EzrA